VFLCCSYCRATVSRITDTERLTPAAPEDLADALAFALRFDGRRRKHDVDVRARRVATRRGEVKVLA
jgi:hypothetical protein